MKHHHAFIQYLQISTTLNSLNLIDHCEIQKSQVTEFLVFCAEIQMYGRPTYKILRAAGDVLEVYSKVILIASLQFSWCQLNFGQDTRGSKWSIRLYIAANLATGGFLFFH